MSYVMYGIILLLILFESIKIFRRNDYLFRSNDDRIIGIILGLFLVAISIFTLLSNLGDMSEAYEEAQVFLVPDYFDQGYEIYLSTDLADIERYFYENDFEEKGQNMMMLRYKLSRMKSSIRSLISGLLALVVAVSMRYDSIHESGIRIKSKLYKWSKLKSYNWNDTIIKDGIELSELIIIEEIKFIIKKDKKLKMMFRPGYKYDIDMFLRGNTTNSDIA